MVVCRSLNKGHRVAGYHSGLYISQLLAMIESIYQNMWDNFSEAVRDERYVQDPYLKDKADTRRGIRSPICNPTTP